MSSSWIKNNVKKNASNVNLPQKALEALALFPSISLQELSIKVQEPEDKVKDALDNYTITTPSYTDIYFFIEDEDGIERLPEQYLDFLQHSIVIVKHNDDRGGCTYELSLFGVVLVMTLVRYHERNSNDTILFNEGLPLSDYYEKISSNYFSKLTLIFGKWHLLKKHLKIWSEYNFDIILAEEKARSTALDYPVSLGGNKEYYQSMQSLVHYNYIQLKEIFDIGLHTYGQYPESELDYYYHSLDYYKQKRGKAKRNELNDTNTKKRIVAVHQKLQEIYELLQFADPIASQHELVEKQLRQTQKQKGNTMKDNKSQDFEQMKNDECSYSNNSDHPIVEILETGFAKEITFLYYLNLNNNIYIPILFPISNFQSFQTLILESTLAYVRKETSQNGEKVDFLSNRLPSSILPLSPKEKLSKILRQDQDIGNWFCLCMSDIIAYQNQTAEIMSQSYNQIKK